MKLNPVVCGQWDGCSFWARWDASEFEPEVQYRLRRPDKVGWQDWVSVHPQRDWLVQPVFSEGWHLQLRIRAHTHAEWELAQPVTFRRSVADFEFFKPEADADFEAGSSFHLFGPFPCAYQLVQDLHVPANTPVRAELVALVANGFVHLSRPDLFDIEFYGCRIRNISTSRNHVEHLLTDYVELVAGQPDILTVSFGPKAERR